MKNKSLIFSVTFLFVVVIYVFWQMQFVFYQQDEWRALGSYFSENNFLDLFKDFNFLKIVLGEGRVFSAVLGYILMGKFPFNTTPLFLYSLGLHLLNVFLVFWLARKMFNKMILALISAIFFGISSVSYSTVSWYGTSIGTLPAATLILFSVFAFFRWLEENQKKWLLFSFIFLYLSLQFKEIGYFLFLFYPIVSIFFKRQAFWKFIASYWYYLITFLLIAGFRLPELNNYTKASSVFTPSNSSNFLALLFARSILYPFTSFSLLYLPSLVFTEVGAFFARIYYPFLPSPQFKLIVQSVVLDLLSIVSSFVILISLFILLTKQLVTSYAKVFFLIGFTIASFLPYVILSKDSAYFDSRYYYLGSISSSILLGLFFGLIFFRLKKSLLRIIIFLLLFLFIFIHGYITKTEIDNLANLSKERIAILKSISKIKPILNQDKNVFLIEGNKSFYLSEGNFVPFQEGFGYTLLVWYYPQTKHFRKYLEEGYLWDLASQGYKEIDGKGFGFFWNENEFQKSIKENRIPKEAIIVIYYDSQNKELKDNTEQIIEKLNYE